MREHAVVGEPTTCSYTRTCSGDRDGERETEKERSEGALARGSRDVGGVYWFWHTSALIHTYRARVSHIENQSQLKREKERREGEGDMHTHPHRRDSRREAGIARGTFEYFKRAWVCARRYGDVWVISPMCARVLQYAREIKIRACACA